MSSSLELVALGQKNQTTAMFAKLMMIISPTQADYPP
jgi:hypothetical protein